MNLIPFIEKNSRFDEKNLLEFHLEEWLFHYNWATVDTTPEEFSSAYVLRFPANKIHAYFYSRYPKDVNNQFHPYDIECLKLIDFKNQGIEKQKEQEKYDSQVIYRLLTEDKSYSESSMTPEESEAYITLRNETLALHQINDFSPAKLLPVVDCCIACARVLYQRRKLIRIGEIDPKMLNPLNREITSITRQLKNLC